MTDALLMERGVQVVVLQRSDLRRGGPRVRHAGRRGRVAKPNGTMVLVEFIEGGCAWVRRKWLLPLDRRDG